MPAKDVKQSDAETEPLDLKLYIGILRSICPHFHLHVTCYVCCVFHVIFIIIFIYMCVRLGPSASEAAAGAQDDMLVQLVKSLSHLKSAIDDPKMRAVIKTLAPQLITVLGDDDGEVARAHAGEPTSSRPGRKSEEPEPLNEVPKVPMPPPTPPVPKEDKSVVAPDAPSPKGEDPVAEVNSSTHRAAHARLTRRMERCTAINFPNMSRLWNGSRKDTYGW